MNYLRHLFLSLPLIFSSCSVQTFRFFSDKAQEGESIYIPEDTKHPGDVTLYKVGGKIYVRGIRCHTIAKSSSYIESHLPFSEIRIREQHLPAPDAEQKNVYCEVKVHDVCSMGKHCIEAFTAEESSPQPTAGKDEAPKKQASPQE